MATATDRVERSPLHARHRLQKLLGGTIIPQGINCIVPANTPIQKLAHKLYGDHLITTHAGGSLRECCYIVTDRRGREGQSYERSHQVGP